MDKAGKMKFDDIRALFGKSQDVIMERYELGTDDGAGTVHLVYGEGMIRTKDVNEIILPRFDALVREGKLEEHLRKKWQAKTLEQPNDIVYQTFSGQLIVYLEASASIFAINLSDVPQRKTEESNAEISIKGPRDAFVEELATNVALVRKRLPTASLVCEKFAVGKRSRTEVALLYIEDIVRPEMIEEARNRLRGVDVDMIMGSSPLEELLSDNSYSLFPLIDYSTRPDFVADALIRGRFAVVASGAPTALIAPANMFVLMRSPEDAYFSYLLSSFGLLFRYLSLFVSLMLPGFYVAATSYNIEQLPYPMLATIGMSRIGLPFPGPLEAFLMIGMFEVFREAGERLPKAVSSTIAVVGGIIVGEAAIRAGLASATLIVVVAVTAVATFTLVNQSFVFAVSIARIFILICSSVLGIYGFMLGLIGTVLYLSTLSSFGLPYLAPLSPVTWKDLILVLARVPWKKKNYRPHMLRTVDSTRQKRRKP